MSKNRRMVLVAVVCSSALLCSAGEHNFDLPIRKADIAATRRTTDAPSGPLMGSPMCDQTNTIYLRYFPVGTTGSSLVGGLSKISSSGRFTYLTPGRIPEVDEPFEVVRYWVSADGKIYELVRKVHRAGKGDIRTVKYLAIFSKDGSFVSSHPLQVDVFPSFMVPLENGDVFMGGTLFEAKTDSLEREPFLGLVSSDGSVKYSIKRPKAKLSQAERDEGSVDPALHHGAAALGPDGNVYLLLASEPLRVQVLGARANLIREFVLESPLTHAAASGLFVAGGRILVTLYGKDTRGRDTHLWVTYDAQTGSAISAFEPVGTIGMPACWDGKQLQFLVANPSTGQFEIASTPVE